MTNEEAKMFLDNLKVCIDEHPVVADWLVEIADRKTEPSNSEKPNNCEPQTCHTCKYKDVMGCEQPCLECKGFDLYEPKDEPQLTPNYCGTCKHREVPCGDLPCDVCHGYSNYEPKDEPQDECAKEYEYLGLKELREMRQTERSE